MNGKDLEGKYGSLSWELSRDLARGFEGNYRTG
jgi:hypothetical protein